MNYDITHLDLFFQLTPYFIRDLEFEFEDGDLKTEDTAEQEISFILQAAPGNFYQTPQLGVDIYRYLNASNAVAKQNLRRSTSDNMSYDNKDVNIIVLFPDQAEDVEDQEIKEILEDGRIYIGVS